MACNGNNHGPNCQCGWGGVFHGLGLTTEKSLWQRKESYTNPNAKCPRCRASVYFYLSPFGGKVFFDAMGPPWPKHPCTDSFNSSIINDEVKGSSKTMALRDIYRSQPLVALEPGWFHTFCNNIQTVDSDPTVTVFFLGDQGDEKQLFSRIRRDQVDVLWPILLKRSVDRKHYEISTLKAKESEPSELRFTAFVSVNELMNYESALRLQNEITLTKEVLPNLKPAISPKPAIAPKLATERPKLTIDAISGVKEKKQKIKLEEKEKRQKEEATRSAEKAIKKAKERENFTKNSGIDIKKKPKLKLTKSQIREGKKQQQRDLEKKHTLNVDRGPIKTSLELAFENANKKTS
jgi:hypothetical protein